MSIQPDANIQSLWYPLTVIQNNDTNVVLNLGINLSGVTSVEFIVKSSRYEVDSDGETYSATVTDELGGAISASIPAAGLTNSGVQWYHVDLLTGESRQTVRFGPFNIQAT